MGGALLGEALPQARLDHVGEDVEGLAVQPSRGLGVDDVAQGGGPTAGAVGAALDGIRAAIIGS
jgi:hypothetical protein